MFTFTNSEVSCCCYTSQSRRHQSSISVSGNYNELRGKIGHLTWNNQWRRHICSLICEYIVFFYLLLLQCNDDQKNQPNDASHATMRFQYGALLDNPEYHFWWPAHLPRLRIVHGWMLHYRPNLLCRHIPMRLDLGMLSIISIIILHIFSVRICITVYVLCFGGGSEAFGRSHMFIE